MEYCPNCGKGPITTSMEEDVLKILVPPLWQDIKEIPVTVPIRTCGDCDYKFLDHEAAKIKDDRVNEYLYSVGYGRPKEWSPKWKVQHPPKPL